MTSSAPQPFATTRWSLVVAAAPLPSADSQGALAALCEAYWYPLYAFVRRRGHPAHEAQDLTQAFFAELLEKKRLQLADQDRGKFRSFLLGSLSHFLANRWREAQAQKRGGTIRVLSLDFESAEARYGLEPVDMMTPERVFERRWAMTVLDSALRRLRGEYEQSGKLPLFEQLKTHVGGEVGASRYREIADQLEMSEGAVKVAAHRLRRRCRQLLRDEIAQTVTDKDNVDDELRYLFAAIET